MAISNEGFLLKMALDDLIESGQLGKYEEVDIEFGKYRGWTSDLVRGKVSIDSYRKSILNFIRSKSPEIALKYLKDLTGFQDLGFEGDVFFQVLEFIERNLKEEFRWKKWI